ncbi:hypothetical protein GQ53DRAFT_396344 [Thozetella sp. PMI_491]|nr:hypothetical protein GQ53DRAFT_396344 [Thozetella sp. PMI_491]
MEIRYESGPGHLDLLFDDDEQEVRDWWKQFLNEDAYKEIVLEGGAQETSDTSILVTSDTSSSPGGVVYLCTPDGSSSSPVLPGPSDPRPSPSTLSSLSLSRGSSPHRRRSPARPATQRAPERSPEEPFIFCFPADPGAPGGVKKRRRDFDNRRRREVASVRKARACVRCRLRKVSCDTHATCEPCSAAAGPMAGFICSRKKFRETRAASADFRAVEYTKDVLACIERERVPLETTSRVALLRFDDNHLESPSIQVVVQKYGPEQLMGTRCRGVHIKELGDDYQYDSQGGSQYMLVDIPGADALVALMEAQIAATPRRNVGFANAIDRFVLRYSRGSSSLPLRELVADVHRLSCLTKISHSVTYVGDLDDPEEASTSVGIQVALVGKAAAHALEERVLARLDKLLFEGKGAGAKNGLALWACLWALIKEYRMHSRFFDAFRHVGANLPHDWLGKPPYDLEMARHMYHYLVSVYSALFKSTTPLYIDWRLDVNQDLFARDENLLQAFKSLRTETMYFHQESQLLTSAEDRFLKQMILDQEMAMDPRVAMGRRNSAQPSKKRAR